MLAGLDGRVEIVRDADGAFALEGERGRLMHPPAAPVPSPSAERRKQLATQVRKLAEEAKVAIRNERRDANKHVDRLGADKSAGVSEDDAKRAKTRIDEMTKSSTDRVDEMASKKIAEIEEI